jgi:LuxR family maltose regulon positive regulatory protein
MVDSPATPLVLTKLRLPAVRPRSVARPRLTSLLALEPGAAVTLVCAPAGYGKTTLLAAWAQSLLKSGTAVAWYALDAGDDDPIPFGSYLVSSFIQALGPVGELTQLAQRLRASPEPDLSRILPELINALSSIPQDCVLILDDYHLVRNPAIHSAIASLVEHRPENLRLAIGSRSDPPLPLARLRARGQLLEMRTNHLRFTLEEAEQFLNQAMRLQLPQEGIAELEARTEGWIAGLQLASLSLQEPPSLPGLPGEGRPNPPEGAPAGEHFSARGPAAAISGSQRYLVEYLMDEVFDRQAPEVQSFLLHTAILERMSAPLCAALPGATAGGHPAAGWAGQSEAILEQLEKANLFVVPLDEQGDWYRYHHLFREFLQARLNKSHPGWVAALHRRASDWLAANGWLREAAAHAFQTRDWEFAAAFVEQHIFTLILHSEISTIYEWCSAFPEEVMQAHPMLCLMQALALAYNFRLKNRERVEARLQQVGHLMEQMEDGQAAQSLMEMSAVVRTFEAMAPDPKADSQTLLATAEGMLGHYPPGDTGQFSARLLSGYALMAQQEVEAAHQALETARQLALRGGLFFGVVESTFHLARLAHHQGQLARAAELCAQGQHDIAVMLPQHEQELPALGALDVALGCVLLEQDHLEEAEQHLRQGLAQMGAGMNPHYLMTAHLALYRLNEILGQPEKALKCLERLEAAWPDIAFCTRGLRATHDLRTAPQDRRALAVAAAWCAEFSPAVEGPLPGLGPFGAADAYYLAGLAWMRAQIAAGNGPAAESYLQRQLERAMERGLATRVIELSLLEAELAAQTTPSQGPDGRKRAWGAIERALAAARGAGHVRIFDQGPALKRLLAEAAERADCPPYLPQVLAAIGASAGAGGAAPGAPVFAPGVVESLTERELEILQLMAEGASNQAIAAHLVITVGTVKSHINHILGKLGAQNRTEAVARGRAAGLIKI